MPKVFPCFAASDRELARQLAAFLERGAGVEVLLEEGQIQSGEDLVGKVEEGLSADAVLALLSPDGVPSRWVLERWKSVFWDQSAEVNTPVATLLCRDCKFPDLLRRKNFFDLRRDRLTAFRAIKRWLAALAPPPQPGPFVPARQPHFAGREAELERLCAGLADAPGIMAVVHPAAGSGKTALALEFAYRHREDFDAIFWLTCGSRSGAALAGDLAGQLGARLDRDLEAVFHGLRQLCAQHRCLLVLDDACAPTVADLAPRGRTSVLITTRHVELSAALSAELLALEAWSSPPTGELDASAAGLLQAMNACAPCGFHLSMVARTAGMPIEIVQEIADRLVAQGALVPLDQNGPRYTVSGRSRAAEEAESWRLPHAHAVADWFEDRARTASDLTATWPDLQHALEWTLTADWALACTLARRGVAWARSQDRLAEAFEILQAWSRAAESRADRRVLEECAWEQAWILEHWGRDGEALQLEEKRRRSYSDQMAFEF